MLPRAGHGPGRRPPAAPRSPGTTQWISLATRDDLTGKTEAAIATMAHPATRESEARGAARTINRAASAVLQDREECLENTDVVLAAGGAAAVIRDVAVAVGGGRDHRPRFRGRTGR